MKNFNKFIAVALSSVILLIGTTFQVSSTENVKKVILGGEPFGVKFYNNGLIVVDLESYFDGARYVCPAKDGGIKKNDIITKVNNLEVKTNEQLQNAVFSSNGSDLKISITRNGKEEERTVKPKKNTVNIYLLGIWVRDSCAGIGTITYYDKETNSFAALGHGVCDNDTNALLPLEHGEVLNASISGVNKSSNGKIGNLNGYFTESTIGNLTKNSDIGIYGSLKNSYKLKETEIDIARSGEIKTGKAEIFTTIYNNTPKTYDIEIIKICNEDKNSNENFVIEVTNNELLNQCGGIVQGMSGSPIIQNGKLVGAVTHVFVNNPREGYGVLAQNMVANYSE